MKIKITLSLLLIALVSLAVVAASPDLQSFTPIRNLRVTGESQLLGTVQVDGVTTHNAIVDMNGNEITLDADADTSITASTDDRIDFELGGADEITLTAATLDMNDTYLDQSINTENVGSLPTILTTAITYTAAAGGTGAVATIADGEIWIVHKVLVNVTTDFDTTGDDATLVIGDGNDADGFITLADAELQAADTEATGFAAGWQGQVAATIGAYLEGNAGGYVYAPDGGAETIDYLIDETSGETLTAGAATIYVIYTRIQ